MFHLDTLATLVAATLTLLSGVSWSIPSPFEEIHHTGKPVAGGLLVRRWRY